MNRCPLCLNERAKMEHISDGFIAGAPTDATSIPIVYQVTCPHCVKYKITDDAIWNLGRNDEMRQRAVADMHGCGLVGHDAGQGEILTITSEMLQGYWREGDVVSA